MARGDPRRWLSDLVAGIREEGATAFRDELRERPGNSAHASVDDVCELVFERARTPRENQQDAHLDQAMATVVERYGTEPVRIVIDRILVEHSPFRTATADLGLRNIDGIRIGTTAGLFLKELNA